MPNKEGGHEAETIISASVKVEGDFVSQGNVLIEGEVEGSMKTEKDLHVGEHARIAADVAAASATVAGEIRGNVDVSQRLQLEPTAKVYGDIKTRDLVIASGAVVNGRIVMDAEESAARPAKAVKTAVKTAVKKAEKAEKTEEKIEDAPQDATEEAPEKEKEGTKKTINAFFTR
ncbi:MAG: polymer-forming cytoskeletal protein [Patescibacteria group bacterium]|nr:polymer-forming cytoskeletal protein [Patescibacteria group bacterium]